MCGINAFSIVTNGTLVGNFQDFYFQYAVDDVFQIRKSPNIALKCGAFYAGQ